MLLCPEKLYRCLMKMSRQLMVRGGSLVGVMVIALGSIFWWQSQRLKADPNDATLVAHGREVYAATCANCHGVQLEGQPDWKRTLPSGRLPAPPHDPSGHTWHHPDEVLFHVTMAGTTHESDMPAFKDVLSERDVWAVLAFIKSTWPEDIRQKQPKLTPEQKAGLARLAQKKT
jgi:mono/diheme cytochrome c family protein